MRLSTLIAIILQLTVSRCEDPKSNQINEVNPDGSFQFAYQNNDRGGHYHEASGNPVIKIRGRFGSRSPATGRVEETVYTAGPRGFRARGPNVHRKQNLSQVPRSPVGSPTDPLADPYDDPSYAFGFKTKTQARKEEADSSGRVQGEFIYVDDAGEKHGVKYKAGANRGFEVENGVPDSPNSIRYNSPLYKAEPTARGRITFERGPDRQYKFLTSSPDQRRAEATGPDGITRGSYSYLDDKGVQRTVQYIAGAGIGYKVIQSTVGPGTHIAANADVPEHSIKAASNEIAISNNKNDDSDDDDSNYLTGPSGPTGPGYISSTPPTYSNPTPSTYHPSNPFSTDGSYPSSHNPYPTSGSGYTPSSSPANTYLPSPSPYPTQQSQYTPTPSPFSHSSTPYPQHYSPSPSHYPSTPRPFAPSSQEQFYVTTPSSVNHPSSTHTPYPSGPSPLSPSGPSASEENDLIFGLLPPKEGEFYHGPTPSGPAVVHITPSAPSNFYQPRPTYLPTAEAQSPQPFARPTPSSLYQAPHPHNPPPHHPYPVDAIIRNTSNGWFYGVPPGSALRAHIQNIDLVPTHDRALSPSEALRLDEERDARYHRTSHPRV